MDGAKVREGMRREGYGGSGLGWGRLGLRLG